MERKYELHAHQLAFDLLKAKTKNNLGSTVDETESKNYIEWLLKELNSYQHSPWEYFIKPETFEVMCQQAIADKKLNYNGNKIVYNDGKLQATYDLLDYEDRNYAEELTISYLNNYIRNLLKEKTYHISTFDISNTSKKDLTITKCIAAYLVYDLLSRYLKNKIENKYWPTQCKDIKEYILEKDLASIIKLDGTRENVLNLYNHAVRIIAELISKEKYMMISNNDKKCLAFARFLDIVSPFSFISNYKYSEYDMFNKDITIKVENRKSNLSETECVFHDPYGGFSDDYKTTRPSLQKIKYEDLDKASKKYHQKTLVR